MMEMTSSPSLWNCNALVLRRQLFKDLCGPACGEVCRPFPVLSEAQYASYLDYLGREYLQWVRQGHPIQPAHLFSYTLWLIACRGFPPETSQRWFLRFFLEHHHEDAAAMGEAWLQMAGVALAPPDNRPVAQWRQLGLLPGEAEIEHLLHVPLNRWPGPQQLEALVGRYMNALVRLTLQRIADGTTLSVSREHLEPLQDYQAVAPQMVNDSEIDTLAEQLTPAQREVLYLALSYEEAGEGAEEEWAKDHNISPGAYRFLKHRIREKWRRT